jgi:hypothetical protein
MYVGVVMLGLLWLIVRSRYGAAPWPKLPQMFQRPWLVPACAWTSLALFVAQLATIAYEARHQIASACWLHLPVGVVSDFEPNGGGAAMLLPGVALTAFAAAQCAVLACMYLAATQRPPAGWERRIAYSAFALAVAAAILSPAMGSSDVYAYMSYAKLGFAAFSAAPQVIAVPDLPLSSWCFHALLPSAYGPAFIVYTRTLLAAIHQPVAAIVMMRSTNALWLLATIALMRRVGVSAPVVALFAFNPVVLFEYVATAHNDIIPICLVVVAMAIDASIPVASVAIITLAGLFKLPFLAVGAVAFDQRRSPELRIAPVVLSVAAALLLSYWWGGPAYFMGLAWYRHVLAGSGDGVVILLTLGAFVAIGFALARRAYAGIAAFAFPGLATAAIRSWYLLWGLPYGIREKRHLAPFLILLPIASIFTDESIPRNLQYVLYAVACAVFVTLAIRDIAARRTTSE